MNLKDHIEIEVEESKDSLNKRYRATLEVGTTTDISHAERIRESGLEPYIEERVKVQLVRYLYGGIQKRLPELSAAFESVAVADADRSCDAMKWHQRIIEEIDNICNGELE